LVVGRLVYRCRMRVDSYLRSTLPAPELPGNLPDHAQWLAGEGAGSWFVLDLDGIDVYKVARYDPEGKLECIGLFVVQEPSFFHFSKPYKVTYISHCQKVTLIQGEAVVVLERINVDIKLNE